MRDADGNLPNVKDAEFAALQAEVRSDPIRLGYPAWEGDESAKRAAALQIAPLLADRPQVPNDPPPQIPKPLMAEDLYRILDDAEVQAISIEGFGAVQGAIEAGDRERVRRLVDIGRRKGWISPAKYDAILAAIDSVVDQPDWAPTKLGANRLSQVLSRPVGGIAPAEVYEIME